MSTGRNHESKLIRRLKDPSQKKCCRWQFFIYNITDFEFESLKIVYQKKGVTFLMFADSMQGCYRGYIETKDSLRKTSVEVLLGSRRFCVHSVDEPNFEVMNRLRVSPGRLYMYGVPKAHVLDTIDVVKALALARDRLSACEEEAVVAHSRVQEDALGFIDYERDEDCHVSALEIKLIEDLLDCPFEE